jgi:hypothetical protein
MTCRVPAPPVIQYSSTQISSPGSSPGCTKSRQICFESKGSTELSVAEDPFGDAGLGIILGDSLLFPFTLANSNGRIWAIVKL